MRKCEAQAMDVAATLGRNIQPIPPCDEIATVEVKGFNLCAGCASAFNAFMAIAERVAEAASEPREEWQDSLPEVGPLDLEV